MVPRRILTIALLMLLCGLYALAEVPEKRFELSPWVGGMFYSDQLNVKDNLAFGFRFGYNFNKRVGLEGAVDFSMTEIDDPLVGPGASPHFTSANGDLTNIFYHGDVLFYLAPDGPFNPYLVAGAGAGHYGPETGDAEDKFMTNFGAGAKYWFNDNVAIRLDVRDIMTLDETRHNLQVSGGIVYAFGHKPAPPPPPPPPERSTGIGSPSIRRLVAEMRPPRSTSVNSSGWPSAKSVRPACSTAEM